MLDIKFIRENLALCQEAAKNKNREVDWEMLLKLDDKRRELMQKIEIIRNERNKWSNLKSPNLKTQLEKGGPTVREQGKKIKENLKILEEELREIEGKFETLMLTVPNVPDKSVPVGKDSSGNKEIKKWGTILQFDFPVKDHIELATKLDLIDFERGVKVGGFRAYFLRNEAAQLEFAVLFYTFRKLISKGYTPLIAPSLVKDFTLIGNGQFPWGKEEVYHLQKDDLYLAGTAEVPGTEYFRDETLQSMIYPKSSLPFLRVFAERQAVTERIRKGFTGYPNSARLNK